MFKKIFLILMILCLVGLTTAGCGAPAGDKADGTTAVPPPTVVTNLSKTDMTKWLYREDKDLYYQTGIAYCDRPADESYEKLAVFVPGAYMDAAENGDGTYTCALNESAAVNGYTAASAPIVMPVYTPNYAADKALTADILTEVPYLSEQIAEYTSQGFVFVHAGCRGLTEGAPAGVTDLKAAIRYLRWCDDVLAGDAESIFVFGMSGGGAQAAILGASGNSALYDPYLKAIGAIQGVSDAVTGSMDWCPITDLDTADAEYEWMMGCTRTGRSKEWQAISDALAEAFAAYVNRAGFVDDHGDPLTLEESEEGIYQAGSYYDYLKRVIERSLNNYLSDAAFLPDDAQDYIDGLNADKKWITYDKASNTASISSIADFVKTCKRASDYDLAFDYPSSRHPLFGLGDGKGVHYDSLLAGILTELDSEYAPSYNADLQKTDPIGYTVGQRVNMYTPLYYLMESRKGYGTSTVAKYWRIRTGIKQPTTSLTTEVDLALALGNCDGVESVDFETVWDQSHDEAERSGSSTENFIAWVNACMKG